MSILLAIETTTPACSAALSYGSTVIERFELAPRQHTNLILPMIESLLEQAGVTRSQLDGIAFGKGPGSFMGTRLALGIAQGLGYALDKPLFPVSTLQILAQTAYEQFGLEAVIAGWDARMQELYWGAYALKEGLMCECRPDVLQAPGDLQIDVGDAALVGNAWDMYNDELPKALLSAASTIKTDCYPHAASLLSIAKKAFLSKEGVNPLAIEPVYFREAVSS